MKRSDTTNDLLRWWMHQSKLFFDGTQSNATFQKNIHFSEHQKKINEWVKASSREWIKRLTLSNESCTAFLHYFKKITEEANQKFLRVCKQRKKIADVVELYNLWLNCCHESYTKALEKADFQRIYGEMINNNLNLWLSYHNNDIFRL